MKIWTKMDKNVNIDKIGNVNAIENMDKNEKNGQK